MPTVDVGCSSSSVPLRITLGMFDAPYLLLAKC